MLIVQVQVQNIVTDCQGQEMIHFPTSRDQQCARPSPRGQRSCLQAIVQLCGAAALRPPGLCRTPASPRAAALPLCLVTQRGASISTVTDTRRDHRAGRHHFSKGWKHCAVSRVCAVLSTGLLHISFTINAEVNRICEEIFD